MRGSLLAIFLLIVGCSSGPVQRPSDRQLSACTALFGAFDNAVADVGVSPSYPTPVEGYPNLRVDRFLASLGEQTLDAAGRRVWLSRMAALGRSARVIELESLPGVTRDNRALANGAADGLATALDTCSRELQRRDLGSVQRWDQLRERAVVPSEYRTVSRVFGLYPLTSLPVGFGASRWRHEAYGLFAPPLEALPVTGALRRYRPPKNRLPAPAPPLFQRDELGIPEIMPATLESLFAIHAPVWEIDVAGEFDRPGAPIWIDDERPSVDRDIPVTYRYLSYTRWQGEVVPQLNYVVWFSERPRTGLLDILGGPLDGLVWRVTLDGSGAPLFYDSIHPCGCYHMFFPSVPVRVRPQAFDLPEPPLIPQYAPVRGRRERIIIRVQSGTHFIQRVYTDLASGTEYAWRDYNALYATPTSDGGRRSLFSRDGLVSGTERAERWLLWPMGIPSPGGMRERGRHAVAFVGQRHFDDPAMLDRLFKPVAEGE
jgi:hypothetical protein